MRFLDLVSLPLAALWQQKVRTALTTLGVVFGSFVLAACLSIGQGVQDTIERMSQRNDMLRKVRVEPSWRPDATASDKAAINVPGELSPERKERLRTAIHRRTLVPRGKRIQLTRERLQELAALPHVELMIPVSEGYGYAVLGDRSESAYLRATRPENPDGRRRIVAGRFLEAPDEPSVVVNELLLYRLGLINDADLNAAIGRQLRIEFRPQHTEPGFTLYLIKPDNRSMTRDENIALDKIKAQLPALIPKMDLTAADLRALENALRPETRPASEPVYADYTIVGIQRAPTPEEEKQLYYSFDTLGWPSEIVLPYQTAADLMLRVHAEREEGLQQAIVVADREEHVRDLVEQITQMGFQATAPLEHIERERLMYLLIFGGMTCVAGVALLVAAFGIANTMLMSVLERTREIGIMKAVGAGNGILQFIFLLEGALIGLMGGGCGLLLAWAASFPGDAYVRRLVSRDLKIELDEAIFVFPPWLAAAVMLFAILVTTLAALCPAYRAARIDPVKALRHE